MSLTPTDLPADDLLQAAATALDEGRPEDTLELVRDLLALRPDDARARFLQAEALRDLRESDAATEAYRLVLDHLPDHSQAWSGMGAALLDQGLLAEADRCFRRAIRLSTHNPDAFYGRAVLRERRGDRLGARRDYLRAWRLSSRYPVPRRLTDHDVIRLLFTAAEGDEVVLAWLGAARIVLTDLPDLDTCQAYDPPAPPAELLGHVAAHLDDVGLVGGWTTLPPAVLLYRRHLARFAEDEVQLVAALREGVIGEVRAWIARAGAAIEA